MQLVLKLFAPVMSAVRDSLKVYPKVEKFKLLGTKSISFLVSPNMPHGLRSAIR